MGLSDLVEFANNPDPRCPCVLLLDTSASMAGEPIARLNEGLQIFIQDLNQDTLARRRSEIAVVSFGAGGVKVWDHDDANFQDAGTECKRPFSTAVDLVAPPKLKAENMTPMGRAILVGLSLIEDRKRIYKANGVPYYRPWMFLVTDGEPTDDWYTAAQAVRAEEANQGVAFFTVGVPPSANMTILSSIASPSRPPVLLKGQHFTEMFQWLSNSQKLVSASLPGQQVPLPARGRWATV